MGTNLLSIAADLMSDDGENSEYDRAIVELTASLLGLSSDRIPELMSLLRAIQAEKR